MARKISLYVDVPAVGQTLNFLVPGSMKVGNIIDLIVKIIHEEFHGIQAKKRGLMLVDTKNKGILNKNVNCLELDIHDGSNLMLL
ncbi:hypothetical protein [Cytobacillus firmus]|uniref:hypothetical protein n=1 Tax=Cytobacillus firmus TaxID=1399 RepID=UPI001C8D1712|nr:hypothetical protein [Cytobacillus firmus]MBX9975178.1 hypothetical protein [Cytobacillus firmus]